MRKSWMLVGSVAQRLWWHEPGALRSGHRLLHPARQLLHERHAAHHGGHHRASAADAGAGLGRPRGHGLSRGAGHRHVGRHGRRAQRDGHRHLQLAQAGSRRAGPSTATWWRSRRCRATTSITTTTHAELTLRPRRAPSRARRRSARRATAWATSARVPTPAAAWAASWCTAPGCRSITSAHLELSCSVSPLPRGGEGDRFHTRRITPRAGFPVAAPMARTYACVWAS